MSSFRIVVVEDEEPVARALERFLRRHQASVKVLIDPTPEALEAVLVEFDPTHVISDFYMPSRTGLDVLAQAMRVAPGARRALFSGSLQSVPAARLLSLQPLVLLPKPWNNDTLAADLGLSPA